MLIGFQARFAPFVEEGSKTHTIRAIRKIAPKVGEICHCYANPRQKTMRLLGRFKCVKVEDIRIRKWGDLDLKILLGGVELNHDEANALLYRDGFRDEDGRTAMRQARAFWEERLPFNGTMIHWKFEEGTRG